MSALLPLNWQRVSSCEDNSVSLIYCISAGELNHLPALFTCHLCAAANPAIASRLQSNALVGRVAELGSLEAKAGWRFPLPFRAFHRYSHTRERCGSVPSSGFEIFVPGRQDDPVYRSADLFGRTVSHFLLRELITPWIMPHFTPNQSLEPTAG